MAKIQIFIKMKKTILLLLVFSAVKIFAQSKYTIEQVEKSNDTKVLANFIVNNPNHPKTPELKKRMAQLVAANHSTHEASKSHASASKTTQNHTTKHSRKHDKKKHEETAEILNHLLNDSSKSNSVLVAIKNQSKCSISVNFKGKKAYVLNIPANSTGRILVDKGTYKISSLICNAPFHTEKHIQSGIQMTLNSK